MIAKVKLAYSLLSNLESVKGKKRYLWHLLKNTCKADFIWGSYISIGTATMGF